MDTDQATSEVKRFVRVSLSHVLGRTGDELTTLLAVLRAHMQVQSAGLSAAGLVTGLGAVMFLALVKTDTSYHVARVSLLRRGRLNTRFLLPCRNIQHHENVSALWEHMASEMDSGLNPGSRSNVDGNGPEASIAPQE